MVFLKCVYLATEMHRSSHEHEPEKWVVGQQCGRYTELS